MAHPHGYGSEDLLKLGIRGYPRVIRYPNRKQLTAEMA